MTVPAACTSIVKMMKPRVYLHITELLGAVVKIPQNPRHYVYFPRLSMAIAVFRDFPGLENGLPKSQDFP